MIAVTYGKFRTERLMNSVKLTINTEEAAMIIAALGFVEDNLVLDASKMDWHFVPGKPFRLSLRSAAALYLLTSYIKEAAAEARETHPFNPYIKAF